MGNYTVASYIQGCFQSHDKEFIRGDCPKAFFYVCSRIHKEHFSKNFSDTPGHRGGLYVPGLSVGTFRGMVTNMTVSLFSVSSFSTEPALSPAHATTTIMVFLFKTSLLACGKLRCNGSQVLIVAHGISEG